MLLLLIVGQAILIRISRTITCVRSVFIVGRVIRVGVTLDFLVIIDAAAVGISLVRVRYNASACGRVQLITVGESIAVGILLRRIRVAWLALRISLFVLERVAAAVDLVAIVEAIVISVRVVRVGDNPATLTRVQLIAVGETITIGVLIHRVRITLRTGRIRLARLIVPRAVNFLTIGKTVIIRILVVRIGNNMASLVRVNLVTIGETITISVRVRRIRIADVAVGIELAWERVLRALYLVTVFDAVAIGVLVIRIGNNVTSLVRVELVTVVDTVIIGVGIKWVGVPRLAIGIVFSRKLTLGTVDLITVVDAVTIGVRIVRIGAELLLLVIG